MRFHLRNPYADASDSHDNWVTTKIRDGWVWGITKDTDLKTHPCIIPFNELPVMQQAKDHLFKGIVYSLRGFILEENLKKLEEDLKK